MIESVEFFRFSFYFLVGALLFNLVILYFNRLTKRTIILVNSTFLTFILFLTVKNSNIVVSDFNLDGDPISIYSFILALFIMIGIFLIYLVKNK